MRISSPNSSQSLHQFGPNSFLYEDVSAMIIGTENNKPVVIKNRSTSTDLFTIDASGDVTGTGNISGMDVTAVYADLAENYSIEESDAEVGTVILISSKDEVDGRISNEIGSNRILGVVSEKPGFLMNTDLSEGVPIALRGRIKCKVKGPVKKGEPLISYLNGVAISYTHVDDLKFGAMLGRTNEKIDTDEIKLIEVIV